MSLQPSGVGGLNYLDVYVEPPAPRTTEASLQTSPISSDGMHRDGALHRGTIPSDLNTRYNVRGGAPQNATVGMPARSSRAVTGLSFGSAAAPTGNTPTANGSAVGSSSATNGFSPTGRHSRNDSISQSQVENYINSTSL